MPTTEKISQERNVWPVVRCAIGGLLLLSSAMWSRLATQERQKRRQLEDMVDLSNEDSFPASDPPSWTAGRD
jgi:hypothetical protein